MAPGRPPVLLIRAFILFFCWFYDLFDNAIQESCETSFYLILKYRQRFIRSLGAIRRGAQIDTGLNELA